MLKAVEQVEYWNAHSPFPVSQVAPAAQSAEAVHLVAQVPMALLHAYAPQLLASDLHRPKPSHAFLIAEFWSHVSPPHCVPEAAYAVQRPAPSQVSSAPQGGLDVHCPFGSVFPLLTASHLPFCPETVLAPMQLWHLEVQGPSQQKPSTQFPEVH